MIPGTRSARPSSFTVLSARRTGSACFLTVTVVRSRECASPGAVPEEYDRLEDGRIYDRDGAAPSDGGIVVGRRRRRPASAVATDSQTLLSPAIHFSPPVSRTRPKIKSPERDPVDPSILHCALHLRCFFAEIRIFNCTRRATAGSQLLSAKRIVLTEHSVTRVPRGQLNHPNFPIARKHDLLLCIFYNFFFFI